MKPKGGNSHSGGERQCLWIEERGKTSLPQQDGLHRPTDHLRRGPEPCGCEAARWPARIVLDRAWHRGFMLQCCCLEILNISSLILTFVSKERWDHEACARVLEACSPTISPSLQGKFSITCLPAPTQGPLARPPHSTPCPAGARAWAQGRSEARTQRAPWAGRGATPRCPGKPCLSV